jgi:hypothetical protein
VASGVWHPDEYAKLPKYDGETFTQPFAPFFCHQQTGALCAGWVGCHDMQESLGLRMAVSNDVISMEDYEAAIDYECPVPLFNSGAEAAAHGMAGVAQPDVKTERAIRKIQKRRERRGGTDE